MANNSCDTPNASPAPVVKGANGKHKSYDEVPFFPKQWFF